MKAKAGADHRFYIVSQDSVGNMEKNGAVFAATPVIWPQNPKAVAGTVLKLSAAFARKIPVTFGLANDCRVQIRIYDLRGRRVALVADGQFKAGVHTIAWDARQLGSGTYCVRMVAGRFRTQAKLFIGR
jgi:hypothetical protein